MCFMSDTALVISSSCIQLDYNRLVYYPGCLSSILSGVYLEVGPNNLQRDPAAADQQNCLISHFWCSDKAVNIM